MALDGTLPEDNPRGRRMRAIAGLLFILMMAGACGAVYLDPSDNQTRAFTPPADASRTITLKEAQVWYNGPSRKYGIQLSAGTYVIEGEDADFWYFRAPQPMDFRFLDRPGPDNQRFIPGGVALRKTRDLLVPAEIYIDDDASPDRQKVLVFKLGHTFADAENSTWVRDFQAR